MKKEIIQPEKIFKEVVGTQYFAVLNSLGDNLPYSNLVSFVMTGDLKSLLFVTARNTRKYRNIKENNKVSLLIDNRTNRPQDISKAVAITVIGTARDEPDKKDSFKKLFLSRHPHLQGFVEEPDTALILVNVSEYIIAGFKKTQRVVLPE